MPNKRKNKMSVFVGLALVALVSGCGVGNSESAEQEAQGITWDAFDFIHAGGYTSVGYDTQNDGEDDVWFVEDSGSEYWLYDSNFDGSINQMKVRRDGRYFNTTMWVVEGNLFVYAEDTDSDGEPDLYGVETSSGRQTFESMPDLESLL